MIPPGRFAVSVLPIGPFDHSFSYISQQLLEVGDVVEAPFGRRSVIGVVMDDPADVGRELRQLSKVFPFNIGTINCEFLKWVAAYNLIPRGNVLKMILAERSVFGRSRETTTPETEAAAGVFGNIELNREQRLAYDGIREAKGKPFLLEGVTGSGKTEIYLSAVRDALLESRQALILFPEIALTKQISARIEKYFGFSPMIWNSNVSAKNRKIAWRKAISGQSCVVVGARSALFLPFRNLGLIVVDEEHDSSYKQEEGGFYNARDMAVVLGNLWKIPVILSSATPSLESRMNVDGGKYGYGSVKNRFGVSQMPSVRLIDMRQNKFDGFISPILLKEIRDNLSRGEQSLIFLNRRGYSPITLCRSCGEKIICPNCSAWLVFHKSIDRLMCHYCGHKADVPNKCASCGQEESHIPFGPGVERIYDDLRAKLPEARIEVVSSDAIASGKSVEKLLEKIAANEIDIVVGTQILAKGHHFPNITLIGVIDGDLGLHGADLRASEKTYQLINQVAGRAGRADKPGKILIQTFNPHHPLYVALESNDLDKFIELEIDGRRGRELPPFHRFAAVIISGTNRELTEQVARDLGKTPPPGVKMYGPAPAPLFLLRGRTRWRILLKSPKKISLNNIIKIWLSSQKSHKNVKIQIDIDPNSFL
ncbi:MAG: primosomal protein N' [Holosporaceae bacterium]|jgi:primosomal protein N' (replication factor Y)|nr:primosomal protein N' [Holosporaceae bacterium]